MIKAKKLESFCDPIIFYDDEFKFYALDEYNAVFFFGEGYYSMGEEEDRKEVETTDGIYLLTEVFVHWGYILESLELKEDEEERTIRRVNDLIVFCIQSQFCFAINEKLESVVGILEVEPSEPIALYASSVNDWLHSLALVKK
jgi:hypothetical protein